MREVEAQGRRAAALRGDQADPDQAGEVAERIWRLDVLINNAGVFVLKPVGEVSDADHEHQFGVDVRGGFAKVEV